MQIFKRNKLTCALLTTVMVSGAMLAGSTSDAAEAKTKVMINGEPAPVFFNDGDSFRVLEGTYKGAKARLAGYNTLESFGAVHQWGDWTAKEMYVLAKMATVFARDGVWECESDGKTDTYGRSLMWCPALAEELVRNGFAHVMTIDDEPGRPALVAAQKEAIENRRGIWAHGVPAFVLTSLHSAEEDVDGNGTYNRLVSSEDGHSVKWKHSTRYKECDNVCHYNYEVDDAKIDEVTKDLGEDAVAAKYLGKLKGDDLRTVVVAFATYRHINRKVAKDQREALKAHLTKVYADAGRFGNSPRTPGACMVHVPFKRRFGGGRAACLK